MAAFGEFKRAGAALLEEGALGGRFSRLLGRAWARRAAVARSLSIPDHVVTIGVGGSTLGGSYRTPIAIALAARLGAAVPVALVSHGYGARVRAARVVTASDEASEVGDESLLAARRLGPSARVIVAPTRQAALDLAIDLGARVLVFDGLLQARPSPLTFAVLALDAEEPWGSGQLPPAGDLRAEPSQLLASADAIVSVAHDGAAPSSHHVLPCAHHATLRITGARNLATGEVASLESLSSMRTGLSTSIARPDRVRRALASLGIEPDMIVAGPDHAAPAFPAAPIDAWLVTEKCAAWLAPSIGASGVFRVAGSHLSAQGASARAHRDLLSRVFALETELAAPSLCAFAEDAVLDRARAAP
jgi:tetraacyldisaccharide 4'-kinase